MKRTLSIIYSNRLIADVFKCLIENETDLNVDGLWRYDASDQIQSKQSGIVLIEITCPNYLILDIIKKIKSFGRKIIVVGFLIDNGLIEEIIEADVDAYVLKSCSKLNLLTAIDEVVNNNKFFCSPITELLNVRLHNRQAYAANKLTERETEVLKDLVNLKATHQIAEHLNITIATVRTHRKNIMSKLGAKNYIGLLRRACSQGLISDDDDHFCNGCVKVKCKSQSPLFR